MTGLILLCRNSFLQNPIFQALFTTNFGYLHSLWQQGLNASHFGYFLISFDVNCPNQLDAEGKASCICQRECCCFICQRFSTVTSLHQFLPLCCILTSSICFALALHICHFTCLLINASIDSQSCLTFHVLTLFWSSLTLCCTFLSPHTIAYHVMPFQ